MDAVWNVTMRCAHQVNHVFNDTIWLDHISPIISIDVLVHDSLMPLSASLMLTAMLPATVLAIVTAQLTIDETSPIVLYGDPSLTIIASIAFAALLIPPSMISQGDQ
jgi:hypothetical protein